MRKTRVDVKNPLERGRFPYRRDGRLCPRIWFPRLRLQSTLVKVQWYHRVVLYANLLFIPDFGSRPCCPPCSRTSCGPRTLPLMENSCFLLPSLLAPALSVDGLQDADLCVINDTITSHLPQTLSCGLNSIIFMFLVVHLSQNLSLIVFYGSDTHKTDHCQSSYLTKLRRPNTIVGVF